MSGKNCHGGSLIAVKNSLITEDLSTKHDIPDSCVLCSIKLHQTEMIIGSFYIRQKTVITDTKCMNLNN